jgi:hypothetical protein
MKSLFFTAALVLLTACNAPVYFVSGKLVTTVPPDACKGLLTFSEFEAARTRVRGLIHEATRSEDLGRLKAIAAELDTVVQLLKGTLTEEYSRENYQGTFTWEMEKTRTLKLLRPSVEPLILSTNGREVPAGLLQLSETRGSYRFKWAKPMSILEYCTLSDSTMGLIELRTSWPPSLHYLRLGYEKDERDEKAAPAASLWPAAPVTTRTSPK